MKIQQLFIFYFVFLLLNLSVETIQAQNFTSDGPWRGVLHQSNGTEVPFNFEIKGKAAATAKFTLINAEERYQADQITQNGDSLFVSFNQFDNELALKIDSKKLTGVLRKKDGSGKQTPVDATYGETFRFIDHDEQPAADISGTYDVVFKSQNGKEDKKVGLFKQSGKKLYATFMSITGDSRYLEGIVEGNKFYLSSFIGGGIGYYSGTFDNHDILSGTVGAQTFTATKNAGAALPDAYKLTYLKEGYSTFDFSLPDVEGNQVSLKDSKFKDKVVIVTIGGTWCPNCMDEAAFMSPWYLKNNERGVEVVGVQFERKADPTYVKNAMENFRKRFNINYTELFGGLADKNAVAASFPALNSFISFPTILFIDKSGKVDKIYTGFTGPATGSYYTNFVKEFNEEVDKLLAN